MIEVRTAEAGDLADVVRIDRETPEAPHWVEGEYAGRLELDDAGLVRRCLLVAVIVDVVVGYVAGRVVGVEAELESVAVDAAARRQGVGRALCAALMDWCGAQGVKSVDLEVRSRSVGAQRLYAELGFVESGRRPGYYRDPEEDAVLMRWVGGIGAGRDW